jgi:hypothetical protein
VLCVFFFFYILSRGLGIEDMRFVVVVGSGRGGIVTLLVK